MKIFYLSLLLFITTLCITCKSNKLNKENPSMTISYFIIGSGGGFTGAYNKYKVYSNGEVEKFDYSTEHFSAYTKINRKLIDNYFIELERLRIQNRDFDHPGNMTFFIEIEHGDHIHGIKWGDESYPVDEEIEIFFDKVMTEILRIEREP